MPRRTFHTDDLTILHIAVYTAMNSRTANGTQRMLDLYAGVLTGDLGLDFFSQFSQW